MPIYLSMQRVRFSSPDAYDKFKVLFADTRRHLMTLPGFLHLTWWEHPDDRSWYNECSFWTSRGALYDWHKNTYHKYCKEWAANGAIMEDIITNFELFGTRLLHVCPVCNHTQDKKYSLAEEQAILHEQCPQCGFHFPVLEETPSSFAIFKDVPVFLCPKGLRKRSMVVKSMEDRLMGTRSRVLVRCDRLKRHGGKGVGRCLYVYVSLR